MLGMMPAIARIPIISTTDFSKSIVAGADDVSEHVGSGIIADPGGGSTQIFGDADAVLGYKVNCGFRFTSITIPKNSVINTATLTIRQARHDSVNGTPIGTWWGVASDNAGQFSGGTTPSAASKTTASSAFVAAPNGTLSLVVHNVKDIIQEIVNRSGWSSGNALNLFAIAATANAGFALDIWEDYSTTSPTVAKLDVNYT